MTKFNLYQAISLPYYNRVATGGPKNNGPNNTLIKILIITLLLLFFIISFNLHFIN